MGHKELGKSPEVLLFLSFYNPLRAARCLASPFSLGNRSPQVATIISPYSAKTIHPTAASKAPITLQSLAIWPATEARFYIESNGSLLHYYSDLRRGRNKNSHGRGGCSQWTATRDVTASFCGSA